MDRKNFISLLPSIPFAIKDMTTTSIASLLQQPTQSKPMPALFVGHGSPMNAIENNVFSQYWKSLGQSLPTPTAILCISAHWETRGTQITAMSAPQTIHDFGGFPQALFDVQYPALGSPSLAAETAELLKPEPVELSHQWGLDHGCWSILTTMFPQANIPVLQLSLDINKTPAQHYELSQQLVSLRHKGVLIIGSGNIVHNLGMIAWDKMSLPDYGYDWAIQARNEMKSYISDFNHNALSKASNHSREWQLAIPTPEHYLPLLYTLGAKLPNESPRYFNDQCVMGSLAMTSFILGDS
jgi:4,5-DOPA dioxygenase extradiol